MLTDDTEIVSGFLAGEGDAAEIVATWITVSTLSFRRRLGDDWEDAHQEAITELTGALRAGKFQGRGTLKAYVKRVANTTCLDRLRRYRRWKMVEIEECHLGFADGEHERLGERLDLWDQLGRILAQVPENCRHLWRMIIEGLSYREMSRLTGVSDATLRVRVLRCRRRALEIRGGFQGNENAAETPKR